MSFFNNLFGSSTSELPEFWHKIESEEDLKLALEHSTEKPIVIFKHSTRCMISKSVLRNFENEIKNTNQPAIDFYYLDLLNHRNISNEIAEQLKVTHQSPQAILIKDQKAIFNASHDRISLDIMTKHLD
ncbi:thioredoxin family protein [Cloacibacterium rupense]|uniref:Thioredoxin family protein n=1 Tax=Cloacibacterium rupense TaxID=517423 RepID=A0ABQ2NFR6_9FLAO|nr:bacillithiol system redox-active protein YtxJ [Cloacibacterium rupense]GGP02244.1 thioredoxin family protein [Cloacibacterium rupense]